MAALTSRRPGSRDWPHGCRSLVCEALEPRALLSATILHSFLGEPTDASVPQAGVILVGNTLYGVSQHGGAHDDNSTPGLGHHGGVLYKVNTDGSGYQDLHDFGGTLFGTAIPDGYEPLANVTFFDDKIYGTTPFGGPAGVGTIWSVNPDGSGYTLIHAFGDPNDPLHQYDFGGNPFYAPLVPLNGKLYGIATAGGRPVADGNGNGVLFSINPDGSDYTEVHVFDFGPKVAIYNLNFVTDGSAFYGITGAGGSANAGTIYAMNVDGSNFHILHEFNGTTDGGGALHGITLTSAHTLVGTTPTGGGSGGGTLFTVNTDGSNFQVPVNFDGSISTSTTGIFPQSELTEFNGRLYGSATTSGPGFPTISPGGTIFSTALDGSDFKVVYTFDLRANPRDAATPYGQLVTDGTNLFGASGAGGAGPGIVGIGTVFSVPLSGSTVTNAPALTLLAGVNFVSNGQPTVTDLGSAAQGTAFANPLVCTVTNTGTATLTIDPVQLPAGFKLLKPLASSLAPNASDTFIVTLDTASAGVKQGDVVITSNDAGVAGNRFAFPVKGTVTGKGGGGGGGGSGSADLTVQLSGKVPANSVANLTKVKFKLKVLNASKTAAAGASTTVTLLLSADGVAGAGDVSIASFPVGNLAARKGFSVAPTLTLPAVASAGSYQVIAVVDPDDTVAESNENNNTAAIGRFTLAPSNVNFTATAKPAAAKHGKPGSLSVTVRDTGNVPATKVPLPVRVTYKPDGVTDTTLLDTTQVVTLTPNKPKNLKLKLPAIQSAGTFSVQIILDPNHVTADGNPNDNTVGTTLRIT